MFRYLLVFVLAACLQPLRAEEPVRFATYNIRFLDSSTISPARLAQLRFVIAGLEADVIGLEEIKHRKSLELLFNPSDWQLIIDDDSDDTQDLALAVRKSIKVNLAELFPTPRIKLSRERVSSTSPSTRSRLALTAAAETPKTVVPPSHHLTATTTLVPIVPCPYPMMMTVVRARASLRHLRATMQRLLVKPGPS